MVVYNIIIPNNHWTSSLNVEYVIKEKDAKKASRNKKS